MGRSYSKIKGTIGGQGDAQSGAAKEKEEVERTTKQKMAR